MSDKKYTSGEIASAAGLTVRAVQHYDNIGLLPSAGRTEGGRRYYTQEDLIRLEQIVFYKSLDFSLDQIKERLLPRPGRAELLEMFRDQRLLLLQRMEHLHTSFAMIGIMADRIEAGKEPLFDVLLRALGALPGDDIFSRAPQMLTQIQRDAMSQAFGDIEPIRTFYHTWKEILMEAAMLLFENIPPESVPAQNLARRWWDTILSFTGSDAERIRQLSELHLEDRMAVQNEGMLDAANRFVGKALDVYAARNGLSFGVAGSVPEERNEKDTADAPDKEGHEGP